MAVHGVTPFSDLLEEEFEQLYTGVTLSLSLSLSLYKSLNCEPMIVICLLWCLLLSFSLLYKFLLIFALFLELSDGVFINICPIFGVIYWSVLVLVSVVLPFA